MLLDIFRGSHAETLFEARGKIGDRAEPDMHVNIADGIFARTQQRGRLFETEYTQIFVRRNAQQRLDLPIEIRPAHVKALGKTINVEILVADIRQYLRIQFFQKLTVLARCPGDMDIFHSRQSSVRLPQMAAVFQNIMDLKFCDKKTKSKQVKTK